MESSLIYQVIFFKYKESKELPFYYVIPYLLNSPSHNIGVWEVKKRDHIKAPILRVTKLIYNGSIITEVEKYDLIKQRRVRSYTYSIKRFNQRIARAEELNSLSFGEITTYCISLPADLEKEFLNFKLNYLKK